MSGALFQRLKQYGKKVGVDDRLVTELGRLNWFGELTLAQTAAGFRVAEIYGRYEGYKKLRRSKSSPSYEGTYGEAGASEELLGTDALEKLEVRIVAATVSFEKLQHFFTQQLIPRRFVDALEQRCVEDRSINPTAYPGIRHVLDLLGRAWSISSPAAPGQAARGSGRAHTPLHFNKHEAEIEVAPTAAIEPKRPNLDRIYWLVVAKRLRPDLDDKELGKTFDIQRALKDRAVFERKKQRAPEPTRLSERQPIAKLDKPKLSLPPKG